MLVMRYERDRVFDIVRMMFDKRANEWDVPLFKKWDRKSVNN